MIADLFRFLGLGDGFVPDMSVRHRAGGIARSPGLRRAMEDERGLARRLARAVVPPGLRPRVEPWSTGGTRSARPAAGDPPRADRVLPGGLVQVQE
jgi:hypothetical protein